MIGKGADMKASLVSLASAAGAVLCRAGRSIMASPLRFLPTVVLLCLFASEASANHLHYIQLPDDPVYSPRIIDVTGSEDPLHEWIIAAGLNDPAYFSRNGTQVTYARPPGLPLSDTLAVFDAPFFEDVTNAKATAFFEIEVSDLASTDLQSLEIGFTDLIDTITWNEAQQIIRSDLDAQVVTNAPRWNDLANVPYRVQFYYNFHDFVFTAVIIDQYGTRSAPISWKAAANNPFRDFFGSIGGTDPDNFDIYPFVSCQVDCTLTVSDWSVLNCDTVSGQVDIDNCVRPAVGNGIVEPPETCDDGNTQPGDGCDENGQLESIGRICQAAIGMAGQYYVSHRLRNLRRCRNALIRGTKLFQDKAKTLPITNRSKCPDEFWTAGRLAKIRKRVRKLIATKCTDTLVGALPACGKTVDDLVSPDGTAGCLIESHDAAVNALLTVQYGG